MKLLRSYIRSLLRETFISHSFEPVVGDAVVNTNPGCKHFGSRGVVLQVTDLPNDQGKIIQYKVLNNGKNFNVNDILEKTMDQLGPKE